MFALSSDQERNAGTSGNYGKAEDQTDTEEETPHQGPVRNQEIKAVDDDEGDGTGEEEEEGGGGRCPGVSLVDEPDGVDDCRHGVPDAQKDPDANE